MLASVTAKHSPIPAYQYLLWAAEHERQELKPARNDTLGVAYLFQWLDAARAARYWRAHAVDRVLAGDRILPGPTLSTQDPESRA